jgi:hypothetical protein
MYPPKATKPGCFWLLCIFIIPGRIESNAAMVTNLNLTHIYQLIKQRSKVSFADSTGSRVSRIKSHVHENPDTYSFALYNLRFWLQFRRHIGDCTNSKL